jgi:hypothetical protein
MHIKTIPNNAINTINYISAPLNLIGSYKISRIFLDKHMQKITEPTSIVFGGLATIGFTAAGVCGIVSLANENMILAQLSFVITGVFLSIVVMAGNNLKNKETSETPTDLSINIAGVTLFASKKASNAAMVSGYPYFKTELNQIEKWLANQALLPLLLEGDREDIHEILDRFNQILKTKPGTLKTWHILQVSLTSMNDYSFWRNINKLKTFLSQNPDRYILFIETLDSEKDILIRFFEIISKLDVRLIIKYKAFKNTVKDARVHTITIKPLGRIDTKTRLSDQLGDYERLYRVKVTDEAIDKAIEIGEGLTLRPNSGTLISLASDLLHTACVEVLFRTRDYDEKSNDKDGENSRPIPRVLASDISPPTQDVFSPPSWIDNLTLKLLTMPEKERMHPKIANRDKEIEDMFEQLAGKGEKNNIVLIGGTGCGKTTLVEEFTRRIFMKQIPAKYKDKFEDVEILKIDYISLMANTEIFSQIEGKINDLHKLPKEKYILWFDEIHMLVTDGYHDSGRDLANKLKTLILSGIRCIGATTGIEYESRMVRDPAFCRRFKEMPLKVLTKGEVINALIQIKQTRFEDLYNVTMTQDAIEAAVTQAEASRPLSLIDSALEILHQACTAIEGSSSVRPTVDRSAIVSKIGFSRHPSSNGFLPATL